jgi:tetratricopeptide (TPR) repeat protein
MNVERTLRITNMAFVESIEVAPRPDGDEPVLGAGAVHGTDADALEHRYSVLSALVGSLERSDTAEQDAGTHLGADQVAELAGSWDRTRELAVRLSAEGGPEGTRLAIDMLRSIPASDATAQDCANLVRLMLLFDWASAAARAAVAYFERRGPELDYASDPVMRMMFRVSIQRNRPDLILRSIPANPERLFDRPEPLLVFAAVLYSLKKEYENRGPAEIVRIVHDHGQELETLVEDFLRWQVKLRRKGFPPFPYESGRLLPGLHEGEVYAWKGEYGFIQPAGTSERSQRRLFHRKSIADPSLLERVESLGSSGTSVAFELRDPPLGSEHSEPVAHAVVMAEAGPVADVEAPEPVVSDVAPSSADASVADDARAEGLLPEIQRLHDLGRYADVRDWVDRQLERRPESVFFAEQRVKFDSYARRAEQGGAPTGESSIDAGRRAVIIERDLERAELLFRRALNEARNLRVGACMEMLRAGRELLSLLTRRERLRRDELVMLLEESGPKGRTILSCSEQRPEDAMLFYSTYAYNLIQTGQVEKAFEQHRKGIELIDRFDIPAAAKPKARERLERSMAGALVARERHEEAIAMLQGQRSNPMAMPTLARALVGRGDLDEAREVMEELLLRRPDDARTQQLRALLDEQTTVTTSRPAPARERQIGDDEEEEQDLARSTKQLVAQLGRLVDSEASRVQGGLEQPLRIDDRLRRVLRSGDLENFPLGDSVETLLSQEKEDVDVTAQLTASVELMAAVALSRRSTIVPSTRISLALDSLIALDVLDPWDAGPLSNPSHAGGTDRDAVANDLIEVILFGEPRDGGARPIAAIVDDVTAVALDSTNPAHRRVLHLLARTTDGARLLRLASEDPDPAGGSTSAGHLRASEVEEIRRSVEDVRRDTQRLRRAVSMLRLVEEEAVDVKLNQREQQAIADLLSAATGYSFTEIDDRILRKLKDAFRRIATTTVKPTFAVDIDVARDLGEKFELLAQIRDLAKRHVTGLWVLALERVAEHLRETCRRAELAVESPVTLHVEVVETTVDALVEENGDQTTAKVGIPILIRNPFGGGQATVIDIEATVTRVSSAARQTFADSSVRSVRHSITSLSSGSETVIHLPQLVIPLSSGVDLGRKEPVRLDLTVSGRRTLSNREIETDSVERSVDLELRLHTVDDYDKKLRAAQHAASRLKAAPDLEDLRGDSSRRIFGREADITNLVMQFTDRGPGIGTAHGHIIYGLRQTGKTTLAAIVRERLRSASESAGHALQTVDFTVSMRTAESEDPQENDDAFFRDVIESVRVSLELGDDLVKDARGSDGLVELLLAARARSRREPVPLLVIDEFTRMLALLSAGRVTERTRTVWRTITDRGVANVLLIGHGSMKEFESKLETGDYPEFSSFGFTKLNFFSRETVEEMCTRPFQHCDLVFAPGALQEVFDMSGGHTRIALDTVVAAAVNAVRGGRLLVNRSDVIRGVREWDSGSAAQMVGCLVDPQVHDETPEDRARRSQIVEVLGRGPAWLTIQELREACNELSVPGRVMTDHDVLRLLEQLEYWGVVRRGPLLGDDVVRLVPRFPTTYYGPQWYGSGESANSPIEMAQRPEWPEVLWPTS